MAGFAILVFFFLILFSTNQVAVMASNNIFSYGAKSDGRTDAAKALLAAWANACRSTVPDSITVPPGNFFVSQATFSGPCRNPKIRIFLSGNLVAPSAYSSDTDWLLFTFVNGVSFEGSGTIDGQGQRFWNCKLTGGRCPAGTASLGVKMSRNFLISGIRSVNSKMFHISIFGSTGVTVQGVKITAPKNSPNTDGIHVQKSSDVTIVSSDIMTGDDCISMGEGSSDVWIEHINCGPGHGISIGSLGNTPHEEVVKNVTVQHTIFRGTMNGLRIKTWGKPYSGQVRGVHFDDAIMYYVDNPIIIDQNYCPDLFNCPSQNSGIAIKNVSYSRIHGTSTTPIAIKFDCSPSNPCTGIKLTDIKLSYLNKPAQSLCKHVRGSSYGMVVPPAIFNP